MPRKRWHAKNWGVRMVRLPNKRQGEEKKTSQVDPSAEKRRWPVCCRFSGAGSLRSVFILLASRRALSVKFALFLCVCFCLLTFKQVANRMSGSHLLAALCVL